MTTTTAPPQPCRVFGCAVCIDAEAAFHAHEAQRPIFHEDRGLRFVRIHGAHVVRTRFAPECYHCENTLIGKPVTDEGDRAWLPKAQWRTWCTEDCHVASAEKAEAS